MLEKQTHTYKMAGGCPIRADVYGVTPGTPRPAILWLHGGALILGSRQGIPGAQCQLYTDAGYVVVAIDYRLAPETKLPAIVEDLRDACSWVREQGPGLLRVDPARLAIAGHSAGGYLALMSGLRVLPRPRALVSFYGYGDVAGPWYSRPDPFYCRQPPVSREEAYAAVGKGVISESADPRRWDRFYLYCRQQGLWPREVTGCDPAADPAAFDPLCPVRQVDPAHPPTLLLHGTADTDVPCEQSALMAQALARAGIEHEFVAIPGAEHAFDGRGLADPVVAAAFERVLAFLARHLRPSLAS